jgi:hypothetical protein
MEVVVAALPHDITDLYLAPVVLALDAQIEELGQLSVGQLADRVGLESDVADWTRNLREAGLLRTICHRVDCHDWTLAWDSRGVRLTHGQHHVVLGVPATFSEYLGILD